MNPGNLRYLIEIQAPIEAKNTVGEVETTWAPVGTAWAAIDPLRGEERMTVNQVKPTIDTKITIRGNAYLVTPKHRLVYNGTTYDIDSIIDVNTRGVVKEIYCKAVA